MYVLSIVVPPRTKREACSNCSHEPYATSLPQTQTSDAKAAGAHERSWAALQAKHTQQTSREKAPTRAEQPKPFPPRAHRGGHERASTAARAVIRLA